MKTACCSRGGKEACLRCRSQAHSYLCESGATCPWPAQRTMVGIGGRRLEPFSSLRDRSLPIGMRIGHAQHPFGIGVVGVSFQPCTCWATGTSVPIKRGLETVRVELQPQGLGWSRDSSRSTGGHQRRQTIGRPCSGRRVSCSRVGPRLEKSAPQLGREEARWPSMIGRGPGPILGRERETQLQPEVVFHRLIRQMRAGFAGHRTPGPFPDWRAAWPLW